MTAITLQEPRARAIVYHALAAALSEPEGDVCHSLLDAVRQAARESGSPACAKAALQLACLREATAHDLGQRYRQITQTGNGRPLALYESLYREGRLMGQSTLDVESHYRKVGIVTEGGELPDHASVELAFLGYLAEAQAAVEVEDRPLAGRLRWEERTFLRMHPAEWLPEVGRTLAISGDPFYATVGALLAEFLDEELRGPFQRQAPRASVPALADPTACTLCGLCVGSCPLRALGVVEDERETALVLDLSRCVGCMVCLRGCPEKALFAAPTTDTSGVQILRSAARAHCPVCGQPTVSQAELDAVFAALEPDPMMKRQMSLCVACKSAWNSC